GSSGRRKLERQALFLADLLELFDAGAGLPLRPVVRIEEGGGDASIRQCFRPPHDSLMNGDAGRPDLLDGRYNEQVVAKLRRPKIADVDLGYGIDPFAGLLRRLLVDTDRPEHVGPGSLHELQIIGIIDDTGRVGVLEIDRQREAVLLADEPAAIG